MLNRLSAALCAILILLGAPAAQAQSPSAQPDVRSAVLPNGLQVLVVEDHAAPVVQTGVWYRFGSVYETSGKTGLAHALEHMMFRGSQQISASGLDDIVAHLGATMNAETNYDYTHFYFVMPADKLDVALAIESDRMRHALIAQPEWRIERGAVLSELDGDASSPFFSLLSNVRAAAYPNSALGRTPVGVRSQVAAANASDIAKYYREWYAPNNATLVVTGDVRAAEVFALARRYFATIPAKRLPPRPAEHLSPASGKIADSPFPFPFEILDMSYAVPGDTQAGEPAISTLATLLNNERAPFYKALVESNVALAVNANADTQLRGGLLNVFIVLNPGHHADEAQAIFENTMAQALKNGFDPELVADAKKLTIAERVLDTDSFGGLAGLVGYTYGIVRERIEDEDRRLAAITPQTLLAVARTYLEKPSVVGHLSPNAEPPRGSSQKATASATDDFSKRVPTGPVTMPKAVAASIHTPTRARSKLVPERFVLPNGLTVLVAQRTDRPTVSIRGTIDSSPAFEPGGKLGVARLASDVANFGSAHYDFATLRKAIDRLGGQVSLGQTFGARVLASDFEPAVALLADATAHPAFPAPYFAQERDQMANSVAQEQQVSGRAIERAYQQLLLDPGDPALRQPSAESIRALTPADTLAYVTKYWRPDLTTIAVVGNVSPARARAAIESAFGGWRASGPKPDTHLPALPAPHAAHSYVGTDATDVYIQLGQPALSGTNPDADAFALLAQILAGPGAFESRLMTEMRQKRGLVYSVSDRLSSDRDRGDFTITLSAAPSKVESAVKFVRAQLERLQNEPVSQLELTDAKARLVSGTLLAQESPSAELGQLAQLERFGLPGTYFTTLNDRYARITAADVQRVARKYLRPDALIEIYAGPAGPWSSGSLLHSLL